MPEEHSENVVRRHERLSICLKYIIERRRNCLNDHTGRGHDCNKIVQLHTELHEHFEQTLNSNKMGRLLPVLAQTVKRSLRETSGWKHSRIARYFDNSSGTGMSTDDS